MEIGVTGETVRSNVTRIRKESGITMRVLASRLANTARPLGYTTVSQIENGARRVDVDDLVALAFALRVSPSRLLMPPADDAEDVVASTAHDAISAKELWDWLIASDPSTRSLYISHGSGPEIEDAVELIARGLMKMLEDGGESRFSLDDLVTRLRPARGEVKRGNR